MAKININLQTGTIQTEEESIIVGIDLGTTNSLIAFVDENDKPIAIKDSEKDTLVPSVIFFDESGKCIVGKNALANSVEKSENTIYSVKRLLGKRYNEIELYQQQLNYKIIDNDEDKLLKIQVNDMFYSPIQLSAEILKELKWRAEHYLRKKIAKAVITVPAYFNDNQRQATRDAGKLAGLDVLRIINEPTAAGLAYGIGVGNNTDETIAVYDLGGGTFDISIIKIENGIYEVLSTHGDTFLGGDDFDQAIIQYWIKENSISNIDNNKKALLKSIAESAKKQLSANHSFEKKWNDIILKIDSETFNHLIFPLVKQTIQCCKKAVDDAKINVNEIHKVVMVGGSTRVPLVQQEVAQFFNTILYNNINPDEVVALGAAVQAQILSGKNKDVLLLDVTPLSLGIETLGDLMDTLIPRNSKIPCKATRQYTTSIDGQTKMKISVYQGEREQVSKNRKLGEFELINIPAMPAGLPKIDVTFMLNADGILKVSAKELRSNIEQEVEIKSHHGLSDEEVERLLRESIENAQIDIAFKALKESEIEAKNILYASEKFLRNNYIHITHEEKVAFEQHLRALKLAIAEANKNSIDLQIQQLNNFSEPIAKRVMDFTVREALKGNKI